MDQGTPHKPGALKFKEEKVGKILKHMGTATILLNRPPIDYALRSRIDKLEKKKKESTIGNS